MSNLINTHVSRLLKKTHDSLDNRVPEQASNLASGLSECEINEIIENIPFQIPSEVLQLYRWKNGGSFSVTGAFLVDVATFYSLQESIAHLLSQLQRKQDVYSLILFSGYSQEGYDYFAVPLGLDTHPIIHLFYGYGDDFSEVTKESIRKRMIYPSLEHMLHALFEITNSAIRKYDNETISVSSEIVTEISKKYEDETLAFM